MEWSLLAGMAFLVKAFIDLAKFARNKQFDNVYTLLVVFAVGIVVVFLSAATDFADTLAVAGTPLNDLNFYSKILLGLTLGATGSFALETLKSIDHNSSSRTPKLFGGNRNDGSQDQGGNSEGSSS